MFCQVGTLVFFIEGGTWGDHIDRGLAYDLPSKKSNSLPICVVSLWHSYFERLFTIVPIYIHIYSGFTKLSLPLSFPWLCLDGGHNFDGGLCRQENHPTLQ